MSDSKTIAVNVLRGCVGDGGKNLSPGQVVSVTPRTARILIGGGKAEEAKQGASKGPKSAP